MIQESFTLPKLLLTVKALGRILIHYAAGSPRQR
jgi:hypothetical protein